MIVRTARSGIGMGRVAATMRCLVVAVGLAWPALGGAQPAPFIQSFQSQGPAPVYGPANDVQSGDAIPNATTSGAIQAALPEHRRNRRIQVHMVAAAESRVHHPVRSVGF